MLEVRADGTIEYRADFENRSVQLFYWMKGTWEPDAANLYLIVTNVQIYSDREDVEITLDAHAWIRIATAPTNRDAIAVSGFWAEANSGNAIRALGRG